MVALLFLTAPLTDNRHPYGHGQCNTDTTLMLPGNLRTTDAGGPYNLTLLTTQVAEVKSKIILSLHMSCSRLVLTVFVIVGGIYARSNYTDHDIVDFLTNVE